MSSSDRPAASLSVRRRRLVTSTDWYQTYDDHNDNVSASLSLSPAASMSVGLSLSHTVRLSVPLSFTRISLTLMLDTIRELSIQGVRRGTSNMHRADTGFNLFHISCILEIHINFRVCDYFGPQLTKNNNIFKGVYCTGAI